MSDNTPTNKKTAEKSRSSNSSPRESPPPLSRDSFTLAPSDRRTSNTRFGAIGGPAAPPPFRHATSIANLGPGSNTRALQTNQPGRSYVTDLPTWRRGSGQEPNPRAAGFNSRRSAEDDVELYKQLEKMALGKYSEKRQPAQKQQQQQQRPQQREPDQQLARAQSQGFNNFAGFDAPQAPMGTGLGAPRPLIGTGFGAPQAPFGTGQRELFKPMNAKLNPDAAKQPLSEEEMLIRDMRGISHRYLGEATNPANESADIPEDKNCSLWITNLPPDCSYHDLLSAIAVHLPGRVFATFISPPSNEGAVHLPSRGHSAAKVIFYYPWEAQNLLRVARVRRLRVGDYTARAVYNRIRTAPQDYQNTTSRVLIIDGPAAIVDRAVLARIWSEYFNWHDDEVIVLREGVVRGVLMRRLEWRFGSHRAQAVAAAKFMWDHHSYVRVQYGADPCERLV